ncbi:sugar phosphate isomerase/epimerase [candidate division KSB1 bacterium]|nr:sugar phosphate isomerase/epimerase [candidate division KSB1 bacterium]
MKTCSRREFFIASAASLVMVGNCAKKVEKDHTGPVDWDLSFQSFETRLLLEKNLKGTLKRFADIGYKGIELCSPKAYAGLNFEHFLAYPPKEIKQMINDAGLYCKSMHHGTYELLPEHVNATIEYGQELGLEDLVVSVNLGVDAQFDAWKKIADQFNTSGEIVKKAGLQMVYHNIRMGPLYDGVPLYDRLFNLFDPELIKMQLHVHEMSDGYRMDKYLARYPGRYRSIHLFDWKPENQVVPLGQGIVDFKKLLTAAKKGGIMDHGLIVELEKPNPFESLKQSIDYFKTLRM